MGILTVFMVKRASKRKETRPRLSGKPRWRAKKLIIFFKKNEVLSQAQSRLRAPDPPDISVAFCVTKNDNVQELLKIKTPQGCSSIQRI